MNTPNEFIATLMGTLRTNPEVVCPEPTVTSTSTVWHIGDPANGVCFAHIVDLHNGCGPFPECKETNERRQDDTNPFTHLPRGVQVTLYADVMLAMARIASGETTLDGSDLADVLSAMQNVEHLMRQARVINV